jgi:hypothetical protein
VERTVAAEKKKTVQSEDWSPRLHRASPPPQTKPSAALLPRAPIESQAVAPCTTGANSLLHPGRT